MAGFDESGFDAGASPKGAPNLASYKTGDASTVVEASNYFNSVIDSLLQGEDTVSQGFIFCVMSDEVTAYGYTATRATGVVLIAAATLHIYIA